jgi:class 3 adenylate cyclase
VPQQPKTIRFQSKSSRTKKAVILVCDLEGFTRFANRPDVNRYIPLFLNRISRALQTVIYGGEAYWMPSREPSTQELKPLTIAPVHEKFLGDGALYIWALPEGPRDFTPGFVSHLCERLWDLQRNFNEVRKQALQSIPVPELPKRIRFGLARGTVFELARLRSRQREYVGSAINLASRLQHYCKGLDFIASAHVRIPRKTLEANGFVRVIAKGIRGFPKEYVFVDGERFAALREEVRSRRFSGSGRLNRPRVLN